MDSGKLAGMAGLALLLSACGGGGSEEPAGTATEEASVSEAAPEAPAAGDTAAAPGDAAAPPPAFAQCKVCHSVEPGKQGIGPSLAGIYGTKAGEVEGFSFSPAMAKSGLTWDDATLDAFLDDPRKTVPGTKMSFFGLKDPAKRKEVIEYIKTLK